MWKIVIISSHISSKRCLHLPRLYASALERVKTKPPAGGDEGQAAERV